jgi:hypothetical protein
MQEAGSKMSNLLMDASIAKCMNGLGGSKTWEEFIGYHIENRDLVLSYLEDKIDAVTAMYIAMERAK